MHVLSDRTSNTSCITWRHRTYMAGNTRMKCEDWNSDLMHHATLTLHWPDGPLIKYLQFPNILNVFNVLTYSLKLQIMLLSPRLQKLHEDSQSSSCSLNVISQNDPLFSRATQSLHMYPVSPHFLCVAHTWQWLAGYFYFPSHQQQFFQVSVFCNPQRVCLAGHV
jgi:hypothetical protein